MAYCSAADLAQYLPAPVLALATSGQQTQACDDASVEADSYMRGRYQLPLLAWGSDVTRYTAWVACYLLVQLIGYAPQEGSDDQLDARYKLATEWFRNVQRQNIQPDVTPSIPVGQDPVHDLPQVRCQPLAGWTQTCNGRRVI